MRKWPFFQRALKPLRRSRLALEELESRLLPSNVSVTTFHNANVIPGVNANEAQLTPANVNTTTFCKRYTVPLDGQVYAEPLVATGIFITNGPNTKPGQSGVHDVVFVATEHDSLYAIDAGPFGGQVLWQRTFLDATNPSNTNLGALGSSKIVTTVPSSDTNSGDISPEIGITGTPVIDTNSKTLYVSVKTKETVGVTVYYVQRLHAINLADGTDRVAPYLIGATTSGNTNKTAIYVYGNGDGHVSDPLGSGKQVVQFNALREANRAGLELVNGTLYEEWASHGDNGPYHGWVVTWNVGNLLTDGLQLSGVLNTSPNGGLTGIWMGGGVLAMDPDEAGTFYFETGNGPGGHGNPALNASGFPADGDYYEAVVKVQTDINTSPTNQNINGWGLKVADYFIPYNIVPLDNADQDLGSGAPLVLPDSAGIAGHPHLMVAAGKEGKVYLIDRDNMGKFSALGDHVLNAVPNGSGQNTAPVLIGGSLSTPAYYNGKLYWTSGYSGNARSYTINGTGIVVSSQNGPGTAYPFITTSETNTDYGYLPGSVVISANGASNGIAWVMDRNANEIHAYDAASFQTELWNSGMKATDSVGAVVKFATPTVADGQVYVGTLNSLVVYGLKTPPTAVPAAPTLSGVALSGSAVNLTWGDPTSPPNTASGYIIEESTDGTHFTQVTTAPAGYTSLVVGGLAQSTSYTFRIHGFNGVGNSANSNTTSITTPNQTAAIDYSAGFAGSAGSLTLNGVATINGSNLQLTPNIAHLAGSAFVTSPVDVTKFDTQFTFKTSPGSTSDGFMFVIQGVAPTALGGSGGYLGFSDGGPNIAQSIGVKFDLFNNAGEGPSSTGLYLNGSIPENAGSIDLTGAGLDFHSGDPFLVNMAYDGTTLSVLISDTTSGKSASQSYAVNIPTIVGGGNAFVGFTAATGTLSSLQDIVNWTFSPNASQAPTGPTGLGGHATSATAITLTWTNNAANQTGFKLDRATNASFTQNLITQNLPSAPFIFTDTFTGLAPGGTYYYRIRAANLAGESANSNTAPVTIPLGPPKPTDATVTNVSTTAINLQWTDNAGTSATGYLIQRRVGDGDYVDYANLPALNATPPSDYDWTDTNVAPGTSYDYHIRAYNVSGYNDFAGANATTLTLPPKNVTAIGGNGVVTVTWTAPVGAVTYNIYRGMSPGSEGANPYATGVPGPIFVDTGAANGVTYYYKVTAVNANTSHDPVIPSESALSATEGTATPSANAPAAPSGLTVARSGDARLVLNWKLASGAASYNIYRGLFAGGQASTPIATGVTVGHYTDASVTDGTTYFYTVAAMNASGQSARSNEASGNAEAPGTAVWIGGDAGAPTNWSDPLNWLDHIVPATGNVVRFDTTAGAIGSFTSNNDIPGLNLGGVIINDTDAVNGFSLTGQAITLSSGITSSTIGPAPTISLSRITLGHGVMLVTNNQGPLAIASNVDLAGSTLSANGAGNTVIGGVISSSVTSSDSVVHAGPGTLTLAANNTYDGPTKIQGGTLVAATNGALGSTAGGTVVTSGGALAFPSAGGLNYVSPEAVMIAGLGPTAANNGAIENLGSNNTFAGPISLAATATIGSDAGALTLTGAIATNTSNLTVTGTGDTTLSGVISGAAFVSGLLESQVNVANDFTDPGAAALGSDIVLSPQMAEVSNVQNGAPALPTIQHTWTDNDTWIYSGQIFFPNYNNTGKGTLSFAKSVDDSTLLRIDGQPYISDTSWTNSIGTGPITLPTGWHNIEIRFGNGGGGAGADGQNNNGWSGFTSSLGFVYRVDNGPTDAKASSKNAADYVIPMDNGAGNLFRVLRGSGIAKTGTGTLTLGAANTYSGSTSIGQGTVIAAADGALGPAASFGASVAPGASLVLPVGLAYTTATPLLLAGSGTSGKGALESQGNGASFAGPISVAGVASIGSDAGAFKLSGAIAGSGNLSVVGPGDTVVAGTVTLNGAGTLNVASGGSTSFAGGSVSLGTGNLIVSGSGKTTIADNVNLGTGNLVQSGSGNTTISGGLSGTSTATLSGLNGTYYKLPSGFDSSVLDPTSPNWMGNLVPAATARLTSALNFPDVAANSFAPYAQIGGTNVGALWTGTITIPGNLAAGNPITFFTSSDDGSVLYIDGKLVVNNNAFQGNTQKKGTVNLTPGSHAITIGFYQGGGAAIMSASWYTVGGSTQTPTLIPASAFSVATNTVTQSGGGTLTLSGNNTYIGQTAVSQGTLVAASVSALGSTGAGTSVAAGATLALQGGLAFAPEPLTISGTGVAGAGALASLGDDNSYNGTITAAAPSMISSHSGTLTLKGNISTGAGTITFAGAGNTVANGVISSSSGGLSKIDEGALTLTAANTFVGGTTDTAGTINVKNLQALGSGGVTLAGGTLSLQAGSLAGQSYVNSVSVAGNSTIDVQSYYATMGPVSIGSSKLALTGSGPSLSQGPGLTLGTVTLNGNPIFSPAFGETLTLGAIASVGNRTINVSGAGTVNVANIPSGVTLAGTGRTGTGVTVASGAAVNPGSAPNTGTLTALGGIGFASGATDDVELGGTAAGSFDQIVSGDAVNLNSDSGAGANLKVSLVNGFVPAPGQTFTIIKNTGSTLISGTFAGLPEGAIFNVGATAFKITYSGGTSGQDVVLSVPTSAATHFLVSPSASTATAGSPVTFTITALNDTNVIDTGYTGTVTLASTTDPRAVLPTATKLTAGVGTVSAVFKTAGSQTVTVTDALSASITGVSSPAVTELPLATSTFQVSAPVTSTAGIPLVFTVMAEDQFNNPTGSAYMGTLHFSSTDLAASLPTNATLTNGTGTFSATLNTAGPETISVSDQFSPGITGMSNIITNTASALRVNSFTPTTTGFTAAFNKPFLPAHLTLYGSTPNTIHDVMLVRDPVGDGPTVLIAGTLLIDPSNTSVTFKATANYLQTFFGSTALPDGTYTATFVSGSANGFGDAAGEALDGANNNGHEDFTTTFTIANQAAPILSIPDFARGPDSAHAIKVPNDTGGGIPITLANASGVTDVTFTLSYNPSLLKVTGGAAGDSAAPGSSFALVAQPVILDATHATAAFSFHDGTAQSGTVVLGDVLAVVPDSAAALYKSKELLQLGSITVNGAPFTGLSAAGVHVDAYFGDVSGNGSIDALDVAFAGNVARGAATGFSAFPLLDPAIVGDVAGDVSIDAGDVSDLAAYTVHLPAPVIPSIPTGLSITPAGADPTLSLGGPRDKKVARGQPVTVPVVLDNPHPDGSMGMTEAVFALSFNPDLFTVSVADISLGSIPGLASGWQLDAVVDQAAGRIGIELFSTTPIMTTAAGSLVNITLHPIAGNWPPASATALQLLDSVIIGGQQFVTQVDDAQGQYVLGPGLDSVVLKAGRWSSRMEGLRRPGRKAP
jgi:autotransporter-associated beta strand protein